MIVTTEAFALSSCYLRSLMKLSLLPLALLALTLPASAADQWFKGNTHTHTLWSDGNDFPEMVTDWYATRGYQFLALTDHNIIHANEVWMSTQAIEKRRKALGKTTVEKYTARFGKDWVQTRELDGNTEVRLRKLEEYRPLFEKPGQFLLIQAEEISAKFDKAPIHINVLNNQTLLKPATGSSIADTLRANLLAILAHEKSSGQPMLAHLNHPNFQWAITPEEIAEVLEDQFFEIYNGHPMINYEGDEHRAGNEKIWDIVNTLRTATLKAPPMLAVATDDSHHYHGEESSPGRGWVMVRSPALDAASIIKSMRAGDFYASSGVTLDELQVSGKTLHARIHAEPGVTYTTRIVGTPVGYDAKTATVAVEGDKVHPTRTTYSSDVGKTFATIEGTEVNYTPTEDVLYLRAVITSSKPHPNPTYAKQTEMAWIQPWAFANSR